VRSWRRAIGLASVACGLALAISVPAADGACGRTQRFAATKDLGPGRAPLVVGDSVMLGAAEEAAAIGYDLDVRICRPTAEGLDVLRARKRQRRLPRLAVIALGANSDFTRADVRAALRILGPKRMLGLVTPREVPGLSTGDAAKMRAAARRWPGRIVLLDWVQYARKRSGLTYGDGIHLTPSGQRAMARVLERALPFADGPQAPAAAPPPADPAPSGGDSGGGAAAP
jgi:hypothetical protein